MTTTPPFLLPPRNIGEHIHLQFLKSEILMAAIAGAPCPCCNGKHTSEDVPVSEQELIAAMTQFIARLQRERICERLEALTQADDNAIRVAGFDDRTQLLTLQIRAHRIAMWKPPEQATTASTVIN